MLLVEQHRPPVDGDVIECPAGLVGDMGIETVTSAVKRELLEETGYEPANVEILFSGPSSAGSSSEIITFVHASNLTKQSDGGGDENENITVHKVPLWHVEDWMNEQRRKFRHISPRIYIGLHFLRELDRV